METNLVLCSRFHWAEEEELPEEEACRVFGGAASSDGTALSSEPGIDPPPEESPGVSLGLRIKDDEEGGNDDGSR